MVKSTVVKIIIATMGLVMLVLSAILYKLDSIQIRQTKDFSQMFIEETDIIDPDAMISPPTKYSQLLQIDLELREKVAEYMRKNDYVLESGKQEFVRNNPTLEELIDEEIGFKFKLATE